MYKAKISGSAKDIKGVRYAWNSSDLVQAGKGTLDHVDGLEWVETSTEKEEEKKTTNKKTVKK